MNLYKHFVAAIAFVLIAGCATISSYDQYAYAQTTSLKVDALNLMDEATDSFALHAIEIQAVNTAMQKQYEYEKHRPKNAVSTSMWNLMIKDPGLLGGFFNLWKEEGKVSKAAIEEAKKKIDLNFDQIAELESKKRKS